MIKSCHYNTSADSDKLNTSSINETNILFQNIQYLNNKQDQLEILLSKINPDILMLVEPGMRTSNINLAVPTRFSLETCYCRTFCKGGGVAKYSNAKTNKLIKSLEWISEFSSEGVAEFTGVEFKLLHKILVIICIYRPPNTVTIVQFFQSIY